MIRSLKLFLILIPGIPLSILIIKLKFLSAPFVLMPALWFLLFLIASITETKRHVKVVLFNIAAIILVIGLFEFYFWRVTVNKLTYSQPAGSLHRIEGKKYDNTEDDILGYGLVKNTTRKVTSYYNDEVVYEATYTIDNNGLRVSPLPHSANAPAILFFGGSFTYGQGVTDDETMPYLTGILTGRDYAIYNFAIHGHGPQHMLAEIEHGIVRSALTHKPQFAIYQVINDHVNRLKGLQPWLINGPHYTLNENGVIISSSSLSPLGARLKGIEIADNKQKDAEQIEIQTFTGVVKKSKYLLVEKYPGIEFHVIYYDGKDDPFSKSIIKALEEKEINVHRVSRILKDDFWKEKKNPYRIPHDGHPSPVMHRIIADYVVKEIIGKRLNSARKHKRMFLP